MKNLIILLSLLFLSTSVFTQNDKFSSQSDAFIQDLGKFIKDSKSESAITEFELFEGFWSSASLGTENQSAFIDLSNRLAKKRYRAYPHFSSLMKATRLAVDSQKVVPAVMDTLMMTFRKALDNYKRPEYESFFRCIVPFLERNTLNNGSKNDIVAKGKFKIVWREETVVELPEEEEEEETNVIGAKEAWEDGTQDEGDTDSEEDNGDEDEYGDWDSWDDDSAEDDWGTDDAFSEDSFEDRKSVV